MSIDYENTFGAAQGDKQAQLTAVALGFVNDIRRLYDALGIPEGHVLDVDVLIQEIKRRDEVAARVATLLKTLKVVS